MANRISERKLHAYTDFCISNGISFIKENGEWRVTTFDVENPQALDRAIQQVPIVLSYRNINPRPLMKNARLIAKRAAVRKSMLDKYAAPLVEQVRLEASVYAHENGWSETPVFVQILEAKSVEFLRALLKKMKEEDAERRATKDEEEVE